MSELDRTHDPSAMSWIASANAAGNDFPIQNLPFAEFRTKDTDEAFRGGVAIGDDIVDLAALARTGIFSGDAARAVDACARPKLNDFFALGPTAWRALRRELFALLHADAAAGDGPRAVAIRASLAPQAGAEFDVPAAIGDYTDFYTSIYHARAAMKLFAREAPLPPNFQWMPIAYHGRASSIGVSGAQVRRPHGQVIGAGESQPRYVPTERLDYELEIGIVVGTGNALGERVDVAVAGDRVFGICLLNDWSARDIQGWEMAPLGPFQAKNFATTVSPWIVTMDALAPYRLPWSRNQDDPQPLPHLDAPAVRERGAFDIELEVSIQTERMRSGGEAAVRLSHTNFKHQYWSIAQMVAHHAANGCNLVSGDLLGTGTISGPLPEEAGAMLELAFAGQKPLALPNGERRGFLHDGDSVVFTAWCTTPGRARIGFGRCEGLVIPA